MDRARQYTSGWAVAVFIPEGIVNSPMLLYSVHPGVVEKLAERRGISARDLEQQLLAWMLKARFEGKDVPEGVVCAPLFAGDLLANADTPDTTSCKTLRTRLLRNAAGDPEIAAAVRAFYSTWSALKKARKTRGALAAGTMKALRTAIQETLRVLETPQMKYNAKRGVKLEFRASLAIFAATEMRSRGAAVNYTLNGYFLPEHGQAWTAVPAGDVEEGLPAFAKAVGSMQGMSPTQKRRVDQQCWASNSVAWASCPGPTCSGTAAVTAQGDDQQLNDLCTLFCGLGVHNLLFATGKRGDAGLRTSAGPRHPATSTYDGDGGGRVEGPWEGSGSGGDLEHDEEGTPAAAAAAAAAAADDDMFDDAGQGGELFEGQDGGDHEEGSGAAAATSPVSVVPAAVDAPITPDDGEEVDVSESEEETLQKQMSPPSVAPAGCNDLARGTLRRQ